MSNTAISVEGLGKRYRIGAAAERLDSLRSALAHAAVAPFRNLAGLRRLSRFQGDDQDVVWALRDVSFEVKHGEVLGIIGRNGAGKSTLLKILSRITKPTTGRARVYGRVGSLLEVGTGFHPELTGRENVYLNGSILGMDRAYIDRKFAEIVEFSGVEKFIDTPVKRYSSGMYLRLAFSVAAHLEPEVLVVDEVLAVGDAEFQKKCMGKMGEVAGEGRTVLFVSHNLHAVAELTSRSLLLSGGSVSASGATSAVLRKYLGSGDGGTASALYVAGSAPADGVVQARIVSSDPGGVHRWGKPIEFEFVIALSERYASPAFSFHVLDDRQRRVLHCWLLDFHDRAPGPGRYRLRCEIPALRLYMGDYTIETWLADRHGHRTLENLTNICPFRVTMEGVHRPEYEWAPDACVYLEDAIWQRPEALTPTLAGAPGPDVLSPHDGRPLTSREVPT